jgi:pSer/pThr/pTyr-binding forkhead associated (FHA) protein
MSHLAASIGKFRWPMPYIVLAEKDREIDRRELSGPLVLGRSPDCDVAVRDILLSRHHCAIEPLGSYWVVADLGSKNGTWLRGHRITRHVLAEGEVLKMGKIQLCFRSGAFIPAPPREAKPAGTRAADPKEALAGTVAGFRFEDDEKQLDTKVIQNFPRPKPRPRAPKSLVSDEVHVMLADIASSSWDSALMDSSRRKDPLYLPKPILKEISPPPENEITAKARSREEEEKQKEIKNSSQEKMNSFGPSHLRGKFFVVLFKVIAWLCAAIIVAGWVMHLPR